QARAGALDALIESGVLTPAWGGADPLGRELRQLVSARSAEAELEELRRRPGPGPQAPALRAGAGTKDARRWRRGPSGQRPGPISTTARSSSSWRAGY